MKRRLFVLSGLATTGGCLLGCGPQASWRVGTPEPAQTDAPAITLNGWVRITPDHRVIVAVPRAEMGQGIHTALAMLVAEELDADWASVEVEPAPLARLYANTTLLTLMAPLDAQDERWQVRTARGALEGLGYALSLQITGGSSSVRDAWEPMRLAGATARALLLQAAAQHWQVPLQECTLSQGQLRHPPSQRQARFGDLAALAARQTPPAHITPKSPAEFRLIGQPTPRLDLPAKTTGAARFGLDVRPPGLLHAAIRHCPTLGGTVAHWDGTAAGQRRGVQAVLAVDDRAVVVVADNTWRAQQALQHVDITWRTDTATPDGLAHFNSADFSARLHQDLQSFDTGTVFRDTGDAATTLASVPASQQLEAVYEVPFLAHAALEPLNCTALFEAATQHLTLWCGTQVPGLARWRAARRAGIPEANITLHHPYLGGSFGRRLYWDMVEAAVAVAVQHPNVPIQLTWSREEDVQHDHYRPAAASRLRGAWDDSGQPLAWQQSVAAPSLAQATVRQLWPALAGLADLPDKNQIEGAYELPYAIAHLQVRQQRTPCPVPVGSWRSVGHSYNAFFTECFADELAHATEQDPMDWRRSLLQAQPRLLAVLDKVDQLSGWTSGRTTARTPAGRRGGSPEGAGRGVALHASYGSVCALVAEVTSQRVSRVWCVLDCGTVVNPDTVVAQVQGAIVFGLSAALHGEITFAQGQVQQSNFHDHPLLSLAETPSIEVALMPSTAAPMGVGEVAVPVVAPAVANALFALTGQRVRRLPLRGLSERAQ